MDALNPGGWWWRFPSRRRPHRFRPTRSGSQDSPGGGGGGDSRSAVEGHQPGTFNSFPLKQAGTAAFLALTGDTIAQVRHRWMSVHHHEGFVSSVLSDHDWVRALRMASYGFLLYGPGSHAWYQFLDHQLPAMTFQNISLKVLLNQVVLGPCVVAIIFAWNNIWLRKLSQLLNKYQKDALPTLLYGFRFWVPVSVLNFWVVPLQARVAFMSTCSIFWNFYLSTTLSK
ncbi:hypothetical protein QJS10_CPB12g00797 [Acorus calamus]|uniref:Protein Mpv17 n=1 Tax=Acorus calamus TaxID=4465 RepID=A0AAV9DNM3_ACOCL|nr:hypothetical protein QJS10_CPB12g00797 [Acorus calamus]